MVDRGIVIALLAGLALLDVPALAGAATHVVVQEPTPGVFVVVASD